MPLNASTLSGAHEARLRTQQACWLVPQGVPPTCRTWVWLTTSGAAKKKAALAGNYYQIMVAAGATSKYLGEIEQVSAWER